MISFPGCVFQKEPFLGSIIIFFPPFVKAGRGAGSPFPFLTKRASFRSPKKPFSAPCPENCPGYDSATLTLKATAARNGWELRCRATHSTDRAFSKTAVLTAVTKPVITRDPQSVTVSIGEKAVFSVTATGGALSYQWQYKPKGSTQWKDWTGKTKATAEVTAGTESDGCRYRCVVSNAAGSTESGEATLTAK